MVMLSDLLPPIRHAKVGPIIYLFLCSSFLLERGICMCVCVCGGGLGVGMGYDFAGMRYPNLLF